MTKIPAPAMSTVTGLHSPAKPASAEGRPKTPLPITLLTTAAVRAQRPMARMSVGRSVVMGHKSTRLPLRRRGTEVLSTVTTTVGLEARGFPMSNIIDSKTARRGFLGRIAAGAAALGLSGAVPSGLAAEAPTASPDPALDAWLAVSYT